MYWSKSRKPQYQHVGGDLLDIFGDVLRVRPLYAWLLAGDRRRHGNQDDLATSLYHSTVPRHTQCGQHVVTCNIQCDVVLNMQAILYSINAFKCLLKP